MTQRHPHHVRRTRVAVAFAAVTVLALSACGGDSDDDAGLSAGDTGTSRSSEGPRTVEIDMADNEFSPSEVDVAAGETVRFVFTNTGEATHDAVIGDEAAQMAHEEEMRAAKSGPTSGGTDAGMDGMGHGEAGDEAEGAITVEPGSTGELTHTFSAADEVLIGCHEPGHYEAGMRLGIQVTDT